MLAVACPSISPDSQAEGARHVHDVVTPRDGGIKAALLCEVTPLKQLEALSGTRQRQQVGGIAFAADGGVDWRGGVQCAVGVGGVHVQRRVGVHVPWQKITVAT